MTSPILGAYYHDTLIPADKDGLEQSSAAVFESEASGEEFQQDSSSSDNDDDGDANEDLDEDAGRRSSFLLVEVDVVQNVPTNGITRNQMSKELSNDAQSVGFVPVDGFVLLRKHILEQFSPEPVQFAETFTYKSVELAIRTFLGTTFDDHLDDFNLILIVSQPYSTRFERYGPLPLP